MYKQFDDVMVYVPSSNIIVKFKEGDGCNEPCEGCVDYIYYDCYDCAKDFEEIPGGQIDVPYYVHEHFERLEDATDMVMEFIFGEGYPNYVRMTPTPKEEKETNKDRENELTDDSFDTLDSSMLNEDFEKTDIN